MSGVNKRPSAILASREISKVYEKAPKWVLFNALYQMCLKDTGNEDHSEAAKILINEIQLAKNIKDVV